LTDEELDRAGITEGLVRISVGIEDWRDLQRDITDALDAAVRVAEPAVAGRVPAGRATRG
jgi:hypothetical protein